MIARPSRLRLAAVTALLGSSLLHVAAMAISPEFREEVAIEDGGDGQTAVLGSDFADLIKQGDQLEPVEAEEVAAIAPTQRTEPVRTAANALAPVPAPDTPSAAPATVRIEPPLQESPVVPAVSAPEPASSPEPTALQPRQVTPERLEPRPEPQERIEPVEEKAETVAAAVPQANIPVPKPRPVVKPEPKKPAKKAATQGSKTSKSNVSNRSGAQDGKTDAKSPSRGKNRSNAKTASSGNAAASNYPGKVYSKIARTRQRNAGGRGVARVSFSVSPNGQAVGISIAGSSGNARVDRAAVAHVKRASPFPKPPAGAQTRFVIPIEFRR